MRLASGWRGPLVSVGTAVAVLVIVGVAMLALRENRADVTDTPADGNTPVLGDVFDTRTDDFCEWFTADDMNEIIEVAQQRAGTAYILEEFTSGGCDSFWKTPGWPRGDSRARESSNGEGLSVAVLVNSVENQGVDAPVRMSLEMSDPDEFAEHHLLDRGVSYLNRTHQFFWRDGVDGFLRVDGHDDETLYFGFSVAEILTPEEVRALLSDDTVVTELTPEYEDLALAVVNELLRHMNWINSGE